MASYYTPFLTQAGAAIGGGLKSRGLQQQQAQQNKLAGSAYMGDPQAMEDLMQLNPQLGAQIQAQAQKKREQSQQQQLQKSAAVRKEVGNIFENVAKFDTFEEAKQYADPLLEDIQRRYPEAAPPGSGFSKEAYEQAKTIYKEKAPSRIATTIQELDYLDRIKDPAERQEKQKLMMELKGRNKIKQFEGNTYLVGPDGALYQLGTAKGEAEFEKEKAKAKKTGTMTGEAETAARIDFPTIKSDAEYLKSIVRSALDHPGFKSVVGMPSLGKVSQYVGGTDASAFRTIHNQITGKTFMEAYKTLKGGGQITEIEGRKATEALQRLDTALSEADYITAANEFISEIDRLTELAKQRTSSSDMQEFSSIEEAEAANLPTGTKITVGGRSAVVE